MEHKRSKKYAPISGMFKSDGNADAFCQQHAIVDTAKK